MVVVVVAAAAAVVVVGVIGVGAGVLLVVGAVVSDGTSDVEDATPEPIVHRSWMPVAASEVYETGNWDNPGETGVVRSLLLGLAGSEACLGDNMGEMAAEDIVRELSGV